MPSVEAPFYLLMLGAAHTLTLATSLNCALLEVCSLPTPWLNVMPAQYVWCLHCALQLPTPPPSCSAAAPFSGQEREETDNFGECPNISETCSVVPKYWDRGKPNYGGSHFRDISIRITSTFNFKRAPRLVLKVRWKAETRVLKRCLWLLSV